MQWVGWRNTLHQPPNLCFPIEKALNMVISTYILFNFINSLRLFLQRKRQFLSNLFASRVFLFQMIVSFFNFICLFLFFPPFNSLWIEDLKKVMLTYWSILAYKIRRFDSRGRQCIYLTCKTNTILYML